MQGRNLKGFSTHYSKTCAKTCVAAIVSNNFAMLLRHFSAFAFLTALTKGLTGAQGQAHKTVVWRLHGSLRAILLNHALVHVSLHWNVAPGHSRGILNTVLQVLQRNMQQDNQTLDTGRQKRSYKRSVSYSNCRWSQRCRARKHKAPGKVTK